MIKQERLKKLLSYDPETGLFTWIVSKGRAKAGVNPSYEGDGYLRVKIDQKHYLLHRLAWLYMTGEFPILEIDHKDMNRKNNSWSNLRMADRTQQNANRTVQPNNRSGFRGVHFRKDTRKWRATIKYKGKRKSLGNFQTVDEASSAYQVAAKENFGEFVRP